MKRWLPYLVIGCLLAVILAVPVAWQPAEERLPADALRLVILSPHNEQARLEIGQAFSAWHEARYGEPVVIDWRTIGGTSDIERLLKSEYMALAEQGREDAGAGYDLVFGGGDYFFDARLKPGITTPDGRRISITQPIDFEPQFIQDVYPTPTIADKPLYDPEGHWWGVVLSSFGIVYNNDLLRLRNLEEPDEWSDLTAWGYFRWLALSDPAHSGSIRVTYDAILQRYGWDEGWASLRRSAANARYFAASASRVPVDVSAGEAAAGMCIDYYGRFQAQSVGGNRLDYVAPAGATVVTADPVGVLRGAPHRELAIRFVRYLLSVEGQALWSFRVGDPMGPERFELRRSPIRRDLYEEHLDRMIDQTNPYQIAKALPPGTPSYFDLIPTLFHAMAIDAHGDLQAAWQAIHDEADPQQRQRMLEHFDAMPLSPDDLPELRRRWKADPLARENDRLAWTRFFLHQYRLVQSLGG